MGTDDIELVFYRSPFGFDITVYAFKTGYYLSIFSDVYIETTETKTISDYAIASSYDAEEIKVYLYLPEVSLFTIRKEHSFDITLPNFYSGIPLSYYIPNLTSGSTLNNMYPYTMLELEAQLII